jgi:hypothetical protein
MLDTKWIYFLLAGVGLYFLIIMITVMCSPLSRDCEVSEEAETSTAYKLRSRDVPSVRRH